MHTIPDCSHQILGTAPGPRHIVFAAILVMMMSGCVRTVTQARPLSDAFAGNANTSKFKVKTRDGRDVVFHTPVFAGDSIIYYTGKQSDSSRERRAEATNNVAIVEISKTSGFSIAGLLGVGIIGVIALAVATVGVIAAALGG